MPTLSESPTSVTAPESVAADSSSPCRATTIATATTTARTSASVIRMEGVAGSGPNTVDVDTEVAIDRFLASPALSDATRRAYRADLRDFGDWLGDRGATLDDVDVRVLADYTAELGRRRRGLAPTTIGRRLSAVRSLVRHALGPERVPEAALAPRKPRRLPEAPRVHEVEHAVDRL